MSRVLIMYIGCTINAELSGFDGVYSPFKHDVEVVQDGSCLSLARTKISSILCCKLDKSTPVDCVLDLIVL